MAAWYCDDINIPNSDLLAYFSFLEVIKMKDIHNVITEYKEGYALPGSSSQLFNAFEPNRNIEMYEVKDSCAGLPSSVHSEKLQTTGGKADRSHTCDKNFTTKSVLTRHIKTNISKRPYSCSVCGRGFIQQSDLQTHMSFHSEQKLYMCRVTQVGNMDAHIR